MQKKSPRISAEIIAGSGLIVFGFCALAGGHHETVIQALIPFGSGLILCDGVSRATKAAKERVKIRIRRDDDSRS